MYMRATPKGENRRNFVVPLTYGGTAMERTKPQTIEKPRIDPMPPEPTPYAVKASPTAAGILLPRYDSERGGGLERLSSRDDDYRVRRQQAFRKEDPHDAGEPTTEEEKTVSAATLVQESGSALPDSKEGGLGQTLKKLFSDLDFEESTFIALLLLLLGMGEEKGTPLVLLGLLLLLG